MTAESDAALLPAERLREHELGPKGRLVIICGALVILMLTDLIARAVSGTS